jgi:hypothetical protein
MTTGRINQGAAPAPAAEASAPAFGAPQLPGRGDPPRGGPRARDRRRECPGAPKRPRPPRNGPRSSRRRTPSPPVRERTVHGPRVGGRCCATRFRTVLRDMFETLSEVARIPLAPTDKAGLPSRVPAPHMDPSRPSQNSMRRQTHLTVVLQLRQPTESLTARPATPRYRSTIDRKPPARPEVGAPAARRLARTAGGSRGPTSDRRASARRAPTCANRTRRAGRAKGVDRCAKLSTGAQSCRSKRKDVDRSDFGFTRVIILLSCYCLK